MSLYQIQFFHDHQVQVKLSHQWSYGQVKSHPNHGVKVHHQYHGSVLLMNDVYMHQYHQYKRQGNTKNMLKSIDGKVSTSSEREKNPT